MPLETPRTIIAARTHVEVARAGRSDGGRDICLFQSHVPRFLKHAQAFRRAGERKQRMAVTKARPG
jgi:hypothetical protein